MFEKRFFEKLEVYKRSVRFVKDVYRATTTFPKEEQFLLVQQIRRAVISIPLNIAEGSGSTTKKSYSNFSDYSIRSAYEIIAALQISKEPGYLAIHDLNPLEKKAGEICAMLTGFKKSLQNSARLRE